MSILENQIFFLVLDLQKMFLKDSKTFKTFLKLWNFRIERKTKPKVAFNFFTGSSMRKSFRDRGYLSYKLKLSFEEKKT